MLRPHLGDAQQLRCLVHAASPHRCLEGQQLVHGEGEGEQHRPCCALVLLEVLLQAVV